MPVNFENIDQSTLLEYEKIFFEEICLLDTKGKSSLSTPLPSLEKIHFACVQDTVERLTEETGRLSKFQWRNCLFAPIDERISPNDIYEDVFEDIRRAYPSLFIRSYVYVIFIKVQGENSLSLDFDESNFAHDVSKDDMQIYAWNTNYNIRLQGKKDLFNLLTAKQKEDEIPPFVSNKAFIVSNPKSELKRIVDANSDVIDAARAFAGRLDLVTQTEHALERIKGALDESDTSRVLLEGPARSGKTVIAMSLLSKYPDSKMLLMNWYFYDALKDAFKVWGHMSEDEIKNLFSTDESLLEAVKEKHREKEDIERFQNDPELLEREIMMREWPPEKLSGCPKWKNFGTDELKDWRVTNIAKSNEGDYVFVVSSEKSSSPDNRKMQTLKMMQIVEPFPDDRSAKVRDVYPFEEGVRHMRILQNQSANERELSKLKEYKSAIEESAAGSLVAKLLKEIADALALSEQRFFHHDRRHDEGLWVNGGTVVISDYAMVICDEAQRLGNYSDLDEAERLAHHKGRLFLCGDDCQKLNKRGDLGIQKVLRFSNHSFQKFELPESLGIPAEIGNLIKCMLGSIPAPRVECSFKIKLIHDDDAALASAFASDPSGKKHYALPASTGFFGGHYVPGIRRSSTATPQCNDKCDEYCAHKFIPMLSPVSDPRQYNGKPRIDLSREYKFFCAEQIMPNYALSAYELISREVESIYLKIPRAIGSSILPFPLEEGDETESWMKRHLYVLMTRPTSRLVINVEDKSLYEHFFEVCSQAGINTEI